MPRLPEFTQVKSGRKLRFLKMWPRPLNMGTVLLSLVPVKPRRLWEQLGQSVGSRAERGLALVPGGGQAKSINIKDHL